MDQPASTPNAATDPPPPKLPRLQRVLASYRERDWVGITIEVAVVVLGILIAFQVDQWGDKRTKAREERAFLERLYVEFQRGVEELEALNSDHARVVSDFSTGVRASGDPARLASLSRTENFGCGAIRHRAAPFNDTAFDELISSGRLSLVSDIGLRGEIRDLITSQAAATRQSLAGRELLLAQAASLSPYYRYDIDGAGEVVCYLDWERLHRDQQAVNAAVRIYRVHQLARIQRLEVLTLTRRMQRHLACKLGKPECGK